MKSTLYGPTCAECRYFVKTKQVGSRRNYFEGECRRYPPTGAYEHPYEPGSSNKPPLVIGGPWGDWCGEFVAGVWYEKVADWFGLGDVVRRFRLHDRYNTLGHFRAPGTDPGLRP